MTTWSCEKPRPEPSLLTTPRTNHAGVPEEFSAQANSADVGPTVGREKVHLQGLDLARYDHVAANL